MWLEFRNNYSRTISVAVMQRDADACGGEGGGWATHGWWVLGAGETKTAIWTANRYVYFYAKATDGRWWGNPSGPRMYVNPYRKFDSCVNIGVSTWDVVNTASADLGTYLPNRHTVNLR